MQIDIPNTTDLEAKVSNAEQSAKELVILNRADFASAGEMTIALKALAKVIDADFKKPKAAIELARKDLHALYRKHADPVERASRTINEKLWAWDREEKRKERILEAERLRVAKQKEIDSHVETAAALDEAHEPEAAERAINQPITPPHPVAPPIEKPKGLSLKDKWTFEITDPALIPRAYMMPDLTKLRKAVEITEAETKIPGVRAYPIAGVTRRTG